MFEDRKKVLGFASEARTCHARSRIAELADRDPTQLGPAQRSLADDLRLLERYVLGEVNGRLMSIRCHQLARRLPRDFEAIEAELLSEEEIAKRHEARERGEKRRHGRAQGYRWALSKGLPPRIN